MIPGLRKRSVNFYDLMMYVAIARKHFRLMVLLFMLCSLTALTYYVFARPVYHARALIRVEDVHRPLNADEVYSGTPGDVTLAQLCAPHILERTAARLGFPCNIQKLNKDYLKKISLKMNSQRNFEADVWMFNRALALKWTEVMVEEFLAYREEQRINYREALVKSYTREMNQIGKKLDDSIGARFAFDEEKNTAQSLIQLNELSDLPAELTLTKRRLAELERVRTALDDPSAGFIEKLSLITSYRHRNDLALGQVVHGDNGPSSVTPDSAPAAAASNVIVVPSLIETPERWQTIEKEIREVQDEIAQASHLYLPGHHTMRELKKKLDGVTAGLESEYKVQRSRFDLDYKSMVRKQADLEAKLPDYQDANKQYAKLQQQVNFHKAGQLAWDGMYTSMARQLSAIDFTQDKERMNLYYEGILEAKPFPESPNRMRLFLMAIGVGLAAAVGVPFGLEYLDHTIADFAQAESMFQIRGLGIIPALDTDEVERAALMDADDNHEQNLLENFRVIRTNLISMGALTKAPHVVMVTSAIPKEGKTVVSSNLALSFAQMGAKTLILDADLRRGRLHRMFGLRKLPGLTQVLMGKCTLDEACRPTGRENLHVLTAGEHLNTATELLSSSKFGEVLDQLRLKYERIIVDTPPVLGLSETSVIQNMMDGCIFVAWAGRTPIKSMQLAVEMLQNNGANFYGFVLNRLDLADSANYYQYYYYSNDYYRNYHALENA